MTTYTETTDSTGILWLSDANSNRASVLYFGSREKAEAALASLKRCRDCVNCSYCSYCSDCSGCLDCSYCSGCSGCSGCSYCSDCSDCSDCLGLKGSKSTAVKLPSIPRIENINQRLRDAVKAEGCSLDMGDWHTCETTHCRAGWVVTLAGAGGKALESFHNTPLAAQLIYRESGSPINPARFYDSDADAMADIEKCAEEERAKTGGAT